MSKQNKVNPGMYTQRGRLTQDDAAREIAKQRTVGSDDTWQPVQRDQEPPMPSETEGDEEDAGIAAPNETGEQAPAPVSAKPKSPKKTTTARKMAKAPAKKAKAPVKRMARAKKTAATSVRAKAKRGRTTRAKAKSTKRRKS